MLVFVDTLRLSRTIPDRVIHDVLLAIYTSHEPEMLGDVTDWK
jgi:hypothetical protein